MEAILTLKRRLTHLDTRDGELAEAERKIASEREELKTETERIHSEIDALVNAPVSGGRDPTLSLPDEILEYIFTLTDHDALWGGKVERVCRRWRRIARSTHQRLHRHTARRWSAYESGSLTPMKLSMKGDVMSIVATPEKVYAAHNGRVSVYSAATFSPLSYQLEDGIYSTYALAVGRDGTIYVGLGGGVITAWSGVDGTRKHTFVNRRSPIVSLCVGLNGNIYAGSCDGYIQVLSPSATHLTTLREHISAIVCMAVGVDGKIYCGSYDTTITVWEDCARVGTLLGHRSSVYSLAVAPEGTVYSGSLDSDIRVWCGVSGKCLRVISIGRAAAVTDMGVGHDGMLYVVSGPFLLRVRRADGEIVSRIQSSRLFYTLSVGRDGKVYTGAINDFCVW